MANSQISDDYTMTSCLSGPLAGRRRFIVFAFIVALGLLYFSQPSTIPWKNNIAAGVDTDRIDSGPRPGPQSETPAQSKESDQDNYRENDHRPSHTIEQDVVEAVQASPSSLRWSDYEPVGGGVSTITGAKPPVSTADCPSYLSFLQKKPGPPSGGQREFPYVRPPAECRTFNLPEMEELIKTMKSRIKDPDLFRLFENSYPNTLDTMIRWRGYANDTEGVEDMELTYVITGDIDAMWLRDSASQIYSYLPLLKASDSPDSLASLWRGLINSHSRYIIISPYCHSFQPPPESGIPPTHNGANINNHPRPTFDPSKVFDCKWELDSLGSFLQISSAYYARTRDIKFFTKFVWVDAVEAAVVAAGAMRLGTYSPDGHVEKSAYTFTGKTDRGSETLTNDGLGNPVKENGMVRSSFRPSDDACIFQLLTPANMLWAKYLEEASHIMAQIDSPKAENLTVAMREQARSIRRGIAKDAVVNHPEFGKIFAYEVDGYGSANMMDDSNIPSILSMPLFNYTNSSISKYQASELASSGNAAKPSHTNDRSSRPTASEIVKDSVHILTNSTSTNGGMAAPSGASFSKESTTSIELGNLIKRESYLGDSVEEENIIEHDWAAVYQASRKFILSDANPYFMWGPVISAVGGPHLGPGKAWPMAAIVAAMTAYDPISGLDDPSSYVAEQLRMVLDSTSGWGVIHESVNTFDANQFSRQWFGWANGLFGELVLRIADHEEEGEGLLARSWQEKTVVEDRKA